MEHQNTFYKDLANGQAAQEAAAQLLISRGFSVSGTPNEYFPAYDLAILSANCHTCKTYFIEVKADLLSDKTNNIAVEQYKLDKYGNKQESGLSITKADIWLFKAANQFYAITVKKLKRLLAEYYGCYGQVITKDNKRLALLPLSFVQSHFKLITEK